MTLKHPMPVLHRGQRVTVPRAGGAAGTVRRCYPLRPRVFEAIVDLDDGGWALGVTPCFLPEGAITGPPHASGVGAAAASVGDDDVTA